MPSTGDIVLVVSELATNVVKHARTPFTIRLADRGDTVRVEISDGSSVLPAVKDLGDGSRGLRIVVKLSEQWGVDPTEPGKTIWVEFKSDQPER